NDKAAVNSFGPSTIQQNSIFHNGFGIVVGSDYGDGFSDLTLSAVSSSAGAGSTQIQGQVTGLPDDNAPVTIEFFSSAPGDPSVEGQAHVYLGATTIMTDSSGNGRFSVSLPVTAASGQRVTARVTSQGALSFAEAVAVAASSSFFVTTTADNGDNNHPTPGSLRQAILAADAAPGATPAAIAFNIPGARPFTITLAAPLPPISSPI